MTGGRTQELNWLIVPRKYFLEHPVYSTHLNDTRQHSSRTELAYRATEVAQHSALTLKPSPIVCGEVQIRATNNSEATSVNSFHLFGRRQTALCLTADLDVRRRNGLGGRSAGRPCCCMRRKWKFVVTSHSEYNAHGNRGQNAMENRRFNSLHNLFSNI
jgi:hypothetical protein